MANMFSIQRASLSAISSIGLVLACVLLAGAGVASAAERAGARISEASPNKLILAENKQAKLPVIVSANASDTVKAAAQYLAERLQKITGATFEIKPGDGAEGIVVGTIAEFPVKELEKPLEMRRPLESDHHDGREAYAIRTEPRRLLLLGGGDVGAGHAVARFLELLGYRQFYPSPEWEVVPSLPTLSFGQNETSRPAILARHLWFAFGIPVEPYTQETAKWPPEQRAGRSKQELANWARQNQLGESFKVFAAHNYAGIILENKDAFAANPDYYCLLDGKRVPRGICSSNPAVRQMAVERAVRYFEKNPEADMFSMERGDGNVTCQCDDCQAMGNESNRVFSLANEAAVAVRAKYPDKMIGVLAYNVHDMPPDFAIEPNMHVQVARLFNQSGVPFQERVALWRKKTPNLGIYDYFSTFQWGQDRLRPKANAGPTADLELLRNDIRFVAGQGVLSLWSECSIAWGAHGRGNYLASKLMWDPETDVEAALQDFYDKAFGPAAPAMKRYFERVDGQNEYFSNTLLGLAFRDVDEAAKLAGDRPDVQARIDQIKQFLHYNYLHTRMADAKTPEEAKPWFFAMLKHEFRTRYSYMTHWRARQNYLADYAKKFNEPTWALQDWKVVAQANKDGVTLPTPPWLDMQPYTPEETQRCFMEGLNHFQPTALLETVDWSDDLVPVEFPDAPAAAPPESRQVFIDSHEGTVHLYSLGGEALTMDLAIPKGATASEYVLLDTAGTEVARGPIPGEEGTHALQMPVPAAGLYRFQRTGTNPGILNYAVPPGLPNTIVLERQGTQAYTLAGHGGRMFFYVPKGTRQFQYYWNGGEHRVFSPDGSVAQTVTTDKDYVTVPVPPGMDGKPWSFNGRFFLRHFVNIPNSIAPSPQSLLLPREIATADGLTIRTAR